MRCIYRLLSVCVLPSGLRTPHATPLLFIFMLRILFQCWFFVTFFVFSAGSTAILRSSCTKAAPDASKSNVRRDRLDGGSLTTDVAETQVECDLMHLSSCSSDEFSVKCGSNGVKGRLKSSLNFRRSRFCA